MKPMKEKKNACTGCAAKIAHASANGIILFIFLMSFSSFSGIFSQRCRCSRILPCADLLKSHLSSLYANIDPPKKL